MLPILYIKLFCPLVSFVFQSACEAFYILTLHPAFMPSVCNVVNIHLSSLYWHYMFRPNWPSLGVQVVTKESAVLLFIYRCLRFYIMWVPVNNCCAHVWLWFCLFVAVQNVSVGAEVCCMAVGHRGHLL
jgi:hypothetical protein